MRSPSPDHLALLRGFERAAFALADTINRRPALKRAAHAYLRTFGASWVHRCTRNLVRVYGLEHAAGLAPDRGVLLVANHRSFFDLYVVSSVLLRNTRWVREMFFPVRASFFYEGPLGVAVNGVMSAWAMYPPVVRDPARRAFNAWGVDALVDALRRPGALVGFHPEGTRGKGPDPYALLAASPGVGELAHRARPIVLPVFVLGLGNDLPRQVRGNFDGTGAPVTITFGAPLDLARFAAEPAGPATYRAIAEHVRAELARLGAHERALRRRDGLPDAGPPDDAAEYDQAAE